MLLEGLLPQFDVRASYITRIAASPEQVYASVRSANFDHWGLMRALFVLRGLPGLLVAGARWSHIRARGERRPVRLSDVLDRGFSLLGERPGEEMVLGTVGRFWLLRGEVRAVSPEDFHRADEPGTARAAWNFAVRPGPGGRTMLTTETRVRCADAATRRRLRLYWAAIGPFSGLIRREMLAAIRAAAEKS